MIENLNSKTISKLVDILGSQDTTSREICEGYIKRVEAVDSDVRAFLCLDDEDVLEQADASDKRRKSGKILSPYDGIPVAIKDVINVKGQPCTCGSKILESHNSVYDATVITKLREKGFVIFGRNNMDEFAMGSSCENSAYFKTANPWDLNRVPGGSSGGSAAAVAAGEVPASLGSDTGGSVRQPASFCGAVGLKPTYGRVSRYGLVAYASSLDQIGPITRDVNDSAILLDVIGGHDKRDSTSIRDNTGIGSFYESLQNCTGFLDGLKVGVPSEYLELDGLDDEVRTNFLDSIEVLKSQGAKIVDVSFPYTKYGIAAYYVIATAEASANLARFDGIRYGRRSSEYKDLTELYFNTRGEFFGDEVIRRILLGTFVLSSGYYDAYYLRAQKARTLIRDDFSRVFVGCDIVISPTAPAPAFEIGSVSDPLEMYLADIFTISANLAGICGVSVPSGLTSETSLPLGLQILGPHMGESVILKAAKEFEGAREIKEFIPEI